MTTHQAVACSWAWVHRHPRQPGRGRSGAAQTRVLRRLRILLLNPNSSPDFTKIIAAEARRVGSPAPSSSRSRRRSGRATSARGRPSRSRATPAVDALAQTLARDQRFDAAILAGFGAQGVPALQEMAPFPVVDMLTASVGAALLLGRKFSALTGGERWVPMLEEQIEAFGLGSRLASVRSIPLTGAEIAKDQDKALTLLAELAETCVREDGADCVILGGAAVAGLHRRMADRVSVPLLDSVATSVAMAELLARVATKPTKAAPACPRSRASGCRTSLVRAQAGAVSGSAGNGDARWLRASFELARQAAAPGRRALRRVLVDAGGHGAARGGEHDRHHRRPHRACRDQPRAPDGWARSRPARRGHPLRQHRALRHVRRCVYWSGAGRLVFGLSNARLYGEVLPRIARRLRLDSREVFGAGRRGSRSPARCSRTRPRRSSRNGRKVAAEAEGMEFDFGRIAAELRYKLLVSFVGPRPIALVTTLSPEGVVNAAPMSFFNVFAQSPPLLILGLQDREGVRKDTTRNILATGEFVVNLVDEPIARADGDLRGRVPAGGRRGPHGGFTLRPSVTIRPGWIAEAPVAFECRLERTVEFPGRWIVFGEVAYMHVRDACIDPATLRVRPENYRPVARMHGDNYVVAEHWHVLRKVTYAEWCAGAASDAAGDGS